jgi:hypothetical protein
MKWFVSKNSVTISGTNRTCIVLNDHPQFKEIVTALEDETYSEEALFALLDPTVIEARKRLLNPDEGSLLEW